MHTGSLFPSSLPIQPVVFLSIAILTDVSLSRCLIVGWLVCFLAVPLVWKIFVHWSGTEPRPWQWKRQVLNANPWTDKGILSLWVVLICISLTWLSGKEPTCHAEGVGSIPGSGKSYGEGNSNPLPVFLPRKSRGQRTEVGHSPRGRKRVRHNLATEQQTAIGGAEHFSCTCWSFESLRCKNVSLVSLSVLKLDCLFFSSLSYVSSFIFLGVNPLSDTGFPYSLKAELSYETFWKPQWSKVNKQLPEDTCCS